MEWGSQPTPFFCIKKVCAFTGTHTINFEQQRPHCSFILYLNNITISQTCQIIFQKLFIYFSNNDIIIISKIIVKNASLMT